MYIKLYQSLLLLMLITLTTQSVASDDVTFSGNMVQGGLLIGQTQADAVVRLGKEPILVSDQGLFVVGLSRDSKADITLQVTFPSGNKTEYLLPIIERQYKEQRINGLPPKKVTPDPSLTSRIRKETALVRKVRKRNDKRDDFQEGFIWPVTGRISGVYGSRRILNGKAKRPHFGVDIARPTGTPVVATAKGIVTLAEKDLYFSGGTILIDHGHGLTSSYLHLSKLSVEVGQPVKQGDIIGEVGATGRATGPHLHWGMNWFNTRLDPQLLAGPMVQRK